MGFNSLQVCMDSSDWLQGMTQEEPGMDSSSPCGDILTCSRPLIERRLRPPQEQAVKCPRCDSTHTKFCYYNNYSLSQPRYFCKTCRRYWTKGGTLRNIPVGGGCRKNKKVATTKRSNDQSANNSAGSSMPHNPTDLHLSLPEMHLSHLNNILGIHGSNTNFMESKYNPLLENPGPIDFLSRNYDRITFPYAANEDQHATDVKPNTKLLSLDCWQDQGCSDAGKDTYGFFNNLGPWNDE
ncbi:hypothetical protein GOBAR_DD23431 [Gossypium barbadense]|nr:hypothetical protein GOBAR_DD23431 [Gossypium barbadense]